MDGGLSNFQFGPDIFRCQKENEPDKSDSLSFGSGGQIRTGDQLVTLIHYFHNGVDYIIILTDVGRYLDDYC